MAAEDADDPWRDRDHPIEEHMRFQLRTWRFERIGWGAMALIVILALAGLFSHGPASQTVAESTDGKLRVEYERFQRNAADSDMTIMAQPEGGENVLITLDRVFADNFTVEYLTPMPAASAGSPENLQLIYHAPAGMPVEVTLVVRAKTMGLVRGRVSSGQSEVQLTQFVYP
jgi:hypothetical protein